MKFYWLLSILFGVINCYVKECGVTPCTRDVILVIDGSAAMKTSARISQEINVVIRLLDGWTFGAQQVRLAIVGAYFANEFYGNDYFTDSTLVSQRLQQFRLSSMQYGVFPGDFNTTIRFLDERYVGKKAIYGSRLDAQKRIVIFTAHNDADNVASTKQQLTQFANLGYAVTLVGIGVQSSVYQSTSYHKLVPFSFAELASIPQAKINEILDDGVCFNDPGRPTPKPQICTTTTTTTTTPTTTTKKSQVTTGTTQKTTPVRPTQPPFPVGDYQNCSCSLNDLYLDLVFVVDTSVGMGDDGLMMVKAEINTVIGQVTLDPTQKKFTQVGLIKYSKNAEIVFHPSDYTDEGEFTEDLWENPKLQHVDDVAEVDLKLGLEKAIQLAEQMRSGVKKAIVVYASSYNDEGNDDARRLATIAKESGFDIITIAYAEPGTVKLVEKIGELATPRMNFTSFRNDLLVDELEDALCQVNCYCPNEWRQLILENRRYGECIFDIKLDSNWKMLERSCKSLSKSHTGNGHLIYINSALKNAFINQWFSDHWDVENRETANYAIGLSYNDASAKFVWVNGVDNNPYANWAPGFPNLSAGKCVVARNVSSVPFEWFSVDCTTKSERAICQETTCDTDTYCAPSVGA